MRNWRTGRTATSRRPVRPYKCHRGLPGTLRPATKKEKTSTLPKRERDKRALRRQRPVEFGGDRAQGKRWGRCPVNLGVIAWPKRSSWSMTSDP